MRRKTNESGKKSSRQGNYEIGRRNTIFAETNLQSTREGIRPTNGNPTNERTWKVPRVEGLIDWTNATAGEVGEMCNTAKKLQRVKDGGEAPELKTEFDLELDLAHELADVITYAFCVASYMGFNVEKLLTKKFNEVSRRSGTGIYIEE